MLVSLLPFPSVQWHSDKLHTQHFFSSFCSFSSRVLLGVGQQFGLKARRSSSSAEVTQL